MGMAIDTVGLAFTAAASATNAYQPLVVRSGDTLTVRNFATTSRAVLTEIFAQMSTINAIRVRSPLLHDNVQGIRLLLPESPAEFALPDDWSQPLQPQDQLIAEVNDATANATYTVGLMVYYQDLLGAAARLHMPADIIPNAVALKPVQVAVTPTAQQWTDVLITATENLLKANTDYAVMGYLVSGPCCAVGVRGPETSNLRVCGPGVARTDETAYIFGGMSDALGLPVIPVINAANANATFVSVLANVGTAITVTLMLMQLRPGVR